VTRVRIGTRGSTLALWQANAVAARLSEQGYRPDIHIVKTTGDKRQDVSLAEIGGKGLFIKELEEALDRGEIDVAVHSLKDVPSVIPERFVLAGFLERADARDAWVDIEKIPLAALPAGSVVGTSSPRRAAQLAMLHPQLTIEPIRGNVDSRINKVRAGLYAGIVLAAAGLQRLGRESEVTSYFTFDEMLPAAGQGIVTIETLASNDAARRAAEAITHEESALLARAERAVLQKFDDRLDCTSSIAVHATLVDEVLTMRAYASDPAGFQAVRVAREGREPQEVIDGVYADLIAAGAAELLWRA
jgi:hydroxymethylbilane synthase